MNKQSGFTLIELMVTISILAILLGIGVPSFRTMIEESRIRTVSIDFRLLSHIYTYRVYSQRQNSILSSMIVILKWKELFVLL